MKLYIYEYGPTGEQIETDILIDSVEAEAEQECEDKASGQYMDTDQYYWSYMPWTN